MWFGRDTLTASGVYTDTLAASGGCDSIVTLTLTVYPRPVTEWHVDICEGSAYVFGGDTLSESGVYIDTLKTVHGCDSILVLSLKTVQYFETPLQAAICSGEAYTFGGMAPTGKRHLHGYFDAAGGCDSIWYWS
ncbi:MAG: hypothetical protein R3E60_00830 [Alphaproteobacteria bacterium]